MLTKDYMAVIGEFEKVSKTYSETWVKMETLEDFGGVLGLTEKIMKEHGGYKKYIEKNKSFLTEK